MASGLNTKINSYALERGYEFSSTYSNNPPATGTNTVANLSNISTVAPVFDSTIGPPGGAGSWRLQYGKTSGTTTQFTAGGTNGTGLGDGDWSIGFWFRIDTLPSSTYNAENMIELSSHAQIAFAISSASWTGGANRLTYTLNSSTWNAVQNTPVSINTWYYIAARRSGSTVTIFINGTQVLSTTAPSTPTATNIRFGSGNTDPGIAAAGKVWICNYYLTTSSVIGSTQIAEIYTAGTASPAVSYTASPMLNTTSTFVNPTVSTTQTVTINDTPGTATNGHFPEPVISTTTGISYGTEPLTATAEISYLSVSGSVNYFDSYSQVTALMTMPTLSFTFNDNTYIASPLSNLTGIFVNPNIVVTTNISNAAGDFGTATADIGAHTVIAGISISYPANESTASSLMVEPSKFGPTDRNILASLMLASNAVLQGDVYVTPNYYNYINQLSPLLYNTGANNINYGSSNPTTFTKDSAYSYANAGLPLSTIGSGNALLINTAGSAANMQLTWTGQIVTSLKTIQKTRNYTFEFWFRPNSTTWVPDVVNPSTWFSTGYFQLIPISSTATSVTFRVSIDGNSVTTFTVDRSFLSSSNWHHLVLVMDNGIGANQSIKLYLDAQLVGSVNVNLTINTSNVDTKTDKFEFNVRTNRNPAGMCDFDEIVIYSTSVSQSDIINHYYFVENNTPDRLIAAPDLTADAEFVNASFIVVYNNNIPAATMNATSLFVDPLITAQKNLNISETPATASGLFVEPVFYGTPDYRCDATPMTAYAETSQNNFALDGTYFTYVNTNIAPYRYVTLDNPSLPLFDYGSDNDYAVPTTAVGGNITSPAFGINNCSVKTTGSNVTTDGIIMFESEWNDDWATSTDHAHSSFWIQRAASDNNSIGLRVLWNLNSYLNNHHVVLYYYQDKLNLQIKNSTSTQTFESINTLPVFNYQRHHIVIVFDHTGTNHSIKVYLDKVLVINAAIGTAQVITTNSVSATGPNDPAYNRPRLAAGALITPFAQTSLPQSPQPYQAYIDELHWAVTGLNQTGVNNLYNAMPIKINTEFVPDYFFGQNATFVNPSVGAGNTIIADFATASAEMVNPAIYKEFNLIVNMDTMYASAESGDHSVYADDITNINVMANPMFASALMTEIQSVEITVPGPTMNGSAYMPDNLPYIDPYRLLILQQFYKANAGFVGDWWVWEDTYQAGDLD